MQGPGEKLSWARKKYLATMYQPFFSLDFLAFCFRNFKFEINRSSKSGVRGTGALVRVQHLLDAERGCCGAGGGGRAGVRVARRERGGLLVVHRPGTQFNRKILA